MEKKFTGDQIKAITESGNLIVSAGAGAGKTSVLTERICKCVLDGTPIEQILVLTFTRAAAAEMKGRIQKRLQEYVETCDDSQRAFLLSQAVAVNSASISTIDSFCVRILRRHGHAVDLESTIQIADDVQLSVLSDKIRESYLTELSATGDEHYHTLLSAFRSEENVWNAILELNEFLNTQPYPEQWTEDVLTGCNSDQYLRELLECLIGNMKMDLEACMDKLSKERDALPSCYDSVLAVVDEDLLRCRPLLKVAGYSSFREYLDSAGNFATMRFPRGTDESVKKPIQNARNELKACVQNCMKNFRNTPEEEFSFLQQCFTYVHSLVDLTNRFRENLDKLKKKNGLIDFSDAEHYALKILSDKRIADEYREKFKYIAIDEYQDSNGVQDALIECIRRKENLFLVGDVKQSIYRFRSADPSIFQEKLVTFRGKAGQQISLNDNFRCSNEVINAVNTVFSLIMSYRIGGVDYDDNVKLICSSSVTDGIAELHLINMAESEEPEQNMEEDDSEKAEVEKSCQTEDEFLDDINSARLEAIYIAHKIRDIMENVPFTLKLENRKLPVWEYSDFAVLLRTATNAQDYAEIFSREGIPCYAQSSGGYFDAVEVVVLLNYLRIIDNRKQDIPLLSVLRSPFFSFSAEELAQVRILYPKGKFFHTSFFALSTEEPEDSSCPDLIRKIRHVCETISRYKEDSQILSISELLIRIIDETCYYEQIGVLPGGVQRQRNVDALLERSRNFEQSGQRGIWRFLRTVDSAKQNSSLGVPQESAGNAVRILTIHKSKGLEYPVVFLGQLNHHFNRDDDKKPVVIHKDLGIGIQYEKARSKFNSLARRAIIAEQRNETVSEEIRVMYVAMTRAKQQLYLVCAAKRAAALAEGQGIPLSPSAIKKAESPIKWFLSAAGPSLKLFVHKREEILSMTERPVLHQDENLSDEEADFLEASLDYCYPFPEATALPSKQTVSGAVRSLMEMEGIQSRPVLSFDPPAFLTESEPTASMRGTATHMLIERLPNDPSLFSNFRQVVEDLRSRSLLSDATMELADIENVRWFTGTPLWKRMCASDSLHKEWNFTVRVPACSVYPTEITDPVLLQGIMDCCFMEQEGWVLLDYKTDHLRKNETPESQAETHRKQLDLYAEALTKLTGRPVIEKTVVMLSARSIVSLV